MTAPLLALLMTACASPMATDAGAGSEDNGIHVLAPKIYDDRSLNLQLATLQARLAQLTGIDQSSLTTRLGTIQGATSQVTQFGLQALGPSLPGTTTTTGSGTPSTVQTSGVTTGTTAGTNNTTVTTTPSSTQQMVATAPAMTPAAPSLPAASAALPSTFSASSLDTLSEQTELSYDIINLQLLLQGSFDDEYTEAGTPKRHVTLGFPISITTPPGFRYRNAAAEVEVSICNPDRTTEGDNPSLKAILPREKTYNVANITSDSVGLSAGAVVGGILNIGGSFFSGNQTYYIVREQDTTALQRAPLPDMCGAAPHAPVTFAWQFRPVFGQRTVQQGLRQTFAQISFAPGADSKSHVVIRTCWKTYDRKSGIVGGSVYGTTCTSSFDGEVKVFYDTTHVTGIEQADDGDGTITTVIHTSFPQGTRVRLGATFLDDSTAGFQNSGNYLRFIAPTQLLGTQGAALDSPDGSESPIQVPEAPAWTEDPGNPGGYRVSGDFGPGYALASPAGAVLPFGAGDTSLKFTVANPASPFSSVTLQRVSDGSTCDLPHIHADAAHDPRFKATVKAFSDTLDEVAVPLLICTEAHPSQAASQPYPPIVVLGGKVFGLSDAPFKSVSLKMLTFLAPKTLLQGQTSLRLKRLFLGRVYENTYSLAQGDLVSVSDIKVLSATKTTTTYALTGSRLNHATLIVPVPGTRPASAAAGTSAGSGAAAGGTSAGSGAPAPGTPVYAYNIKKSADGTYMQFEVDDASSLTYIVLQPDRGSPITVAIPQKDATPTKASLTQPGVTVPKGSTASYKITGSNLQLVTSIRYLDQPLSYVTAADHNSITIDQLPASLVAVSGNRTLIVTYTDGSQAIYTVAVGP